jgi:hypothetical protein
MLLKLFNNFEFALIKCIHNFKNVSYNNFSDLGSRVNNHYYKNLIKLGFVSIP